MKNDVKDTILSSVSITKVARYSRSTGIPDVLNQVCKLVNRYKHQIPNEYALCNTIFFSDLSRILDTFIYITYMQI